MVQTDFPKIVGILLCVLAVGCAVWQMSYFSTFTVDDAYISFRYAENFAKGDGLVFNTGEYVEGYTNFLWVILLGILKEVGVDVQVSSLILGVLSSFIMLWMTYLLSTSISSHTLKVAAMLYVATSPAFGVWSVAGLETPLFACLFVSAVWFHFREEARSLRYRSGQAGFPISALLFGFLSLVRPEGIMYFGLTMFSACIYRIQKRRQQIFDLWKHCAVFLSIVGLHFMWRWWYYGSLLPNTYYMKVGGEFYLSGIKYVYEFFLMYGGIPVFLICAVLLIVNRFHEYWVRYCLLIIGTSVLYFIYVHGDWMPEFRFFVPLLPLFFLCLQEGIYEFYMLLFRKFSWGATIGTGIIALSIFLNNSYLLYKRARNEIRFNGHVEIGKFLRDNASPDDILAAIDIGAMAYFSGLRTIDYFGLADAHIARIAPKKYTFTPGFWGHQTLTVKSDTEYVLAQHPTFIELNTRNVPRTVDETIPADPFSDLMFRNPTFRETYTPFYHAGGTTIFKRKDR
jgi:arabinofuranosyltransferase